MAFPFAPSGAVGFDTGADFLSRDDGLSEILGPVMAGARARGVADAFEMLGLAAVLIDETGRVLHAGGRAQRALNPLVRIAEDHLVGIDAGVNDALQQVMSGVIGSLGTTSSAADEVVLRDGDGTARLSIRALRFQHVSEDVPQLLHSVLVVTDCTPGH